jgi:NAD(P)-dependent dehydrogenase (short-subunit alcohol dehydrogenase family)
MSRLQNKVALITGGTSGIGLAAAQRFVAEGAFVYIFARRQDELDKTVASVGRNIAGVQGDVRKLDDRPLCQGRFGWPQTGRGGRQCRRRR